jgi:hypothetical protein
MEILNLLVRDIIKVIFTGSVFKICRDSLVKAIDESPNSESSYFEIAVKASVFAAKELAENSVEVLLTRILIKALEESAPNILRSTQRFKTPISINLPRYLLWAFPEEAVSELGVLLERLKSQNRSEIVIWAIFLRSILELFWAFYIQIKIENLWLSRSKKIDD